MTFLNTLKTRAKQLIRRYIHGATCVIDSPQNRFLHPIGQTEVRGWGFFDDGPAHFVEVRLDRTLLLVNKFNHHRPDVLAAHPKAQKHDVPVGFQFLIDMPPDLAPGPHALRFFLLNKTGRRVPAGVVHLEATPATSAQSFSSRFAEIPTHLVYKVNGSLLETDFIRIGNLASEAIEQNLGNLSQAQEVLDFGCGLGRVLLPLLARAPQAAFTGFDVDPLMLEWCDHLLQTPRCHFVPSTLELPDNAYQVICAVSVFTHLSATTDYWLAEIHRLLAPGGKALLTYHDETLFEEIAGGPAMRSMPKGATLTDRCVVGESTSEGGASMGTFYTTVAWENTLGRYFTVEKSVPRGLFGHQSFSVVSKKSISLDRTVCNQEYIRSLERELFTLRQTQRALF